MSILSIDVGTSSVKAALYNYKLEQVASTKSVYAIRTFNVDWAELDTDDILRAIVDAIRNLQSSARGVELVVFDTFSPSLTLIGKNGEAVYPVITHLDRRSKKQTGDILQKIGKERFQSITGIQPFTGGASITSLLWMLENAPNIVGKAYKAGHLNTFIYHLFTGMWATDPVNASMTGMYETVTQSGWSREICGVMGIPTGLLPEIIPSGSKGGVLSDEMAKLTGLLAGTPVALGTNDAAAAQIGADNGKSGDILNIAGSSDMVSLLTDKPVLNESYYLRGFCKPGLWQIYATTAGGFVLDWFLNQMYHHMNEQDFYGAELAAAVELCDDTLPVRFTPYMAGDRQSLEPKRASIEGLTLDATRRQILAAALLGMQQPMKNILVLCGDLVQDKNIIKLTGGLVSPEIIKLKQKQFPDRIFEVRQDCPLRGNILLALA